MAVRLAEHRPLAVAALVALASHSPSLLAQQDDGGAAAKLPRPKVAADNQYDLGRGGYTVRIYFAEGKTYEHHDAHVFFEPMIYLETDEHGTFIHHLEDSGDLILYFRTETDQDFLHKKLRSSLARTAQERSKSEIVSGSLEYRINPLTMSSSWFESSRDETIKSRVFPSKPLAEKGRQPIYFSFSAREDAEDFVDDLQSDRIQLVFKYEFAGVSDEICKAEFNSENIQKIDLFKKVAGPGGPGYVTRNQAVNVANDIVRTENLTARCADPEMLIFIADKLVERLGEHENIALNNWEQLDKLIAFDPDSFKADVDRATTDIEKTVAHRQVLDALSKAVSQANSEAGEGGVALYGGFMLGLSGSLAESDAESTAEARKILTDIMNKVGVYGEWEGTRFLPKSVDVYTKAAMNGAWGHNVQLEYTIPADATASHAVNLTKDARRAEVDLSVTLTKKIEKLRLDLHSQAEAVRQTAEQARQAAAQAVSQARGAVIQSRRASQEASHAMSTAEDAESTAEDAESTAKDANWMAKQAVEVKACHYKFRNPDEGRDETYYYDLGRNDDIAIIGDWDMSCYLIEKPYLSLWRRRSSPGNWNLIVGDLTDWDACHTLNVTVVFVGGERVGRLGSIWDGGTKRLNLKDSWCSD